MQSQAPYAILGLLTLIVAVEQLARENAAVFENNGVLEVLTVGGRRVFPCNQQEVRTTITMQCYVMSIFFVTGYPYCLHMVSVS